MHPPQMEHFVSIPQIIWRLFAKQEPRCTIWMHTQLFNLILCFYRATSFVWNISISSSLTTYYYKMYLPVLPCFSPPLQTIQTTVPGSSHCDVVFSPQPPARAPLVALLWGSQSSNWLSSGSSCGPSLLLSLVCLPNPSCPLKGTTAKGTPSLMVHPHVSTDHYTRGSAS